MRNDFPFLASGCSDIMMHSIASKTVPGRNTSHRSVIAERTESSTSARRNAQMLIGGTLSISAVLRDHTVNAGLHAAQGYLHFAVHCVNSARTLQSRVCSSSSAICRCQNTTLGTFCRQYVDRKYDSFRLKLSRQGMDVVGTEYHQRLKLYH